MTDLMNQLINHEAVYKTALATPGLLNTTHPQELLQIQEALTQEGSTIAYHLNKILPCLCFISILNFQEWCLLNMSKGKDEDRNANHVCRQCCDEITFIDYFRWINIFAICLKSNEFI